MTGNILVAKNKWAVIIWPILPLVLGGSIYVLWRPDTIRLIGWLNLVGLGSFVESIRIFSMSVYGYVPEWIVFSLPNGLWAFSYALIIAYMWWGNNSALKYIWLGSIPVLCLGYEALQYAGVIRGVFCFQDLLLCFTGIVLGITVAVIAGKRCNYS